MSKRSGEVKKELQLLQLRILQVFQNRKGCRFVHPEENCQIPNCKNKLCSKRHPTICKFGEECRFKTSCSYYHPKRCGENEAMEVSRLKRDIEHLKAETQTLKVENESNLTNLVNVHSHKLLKLRPNQLRYINMLIRARS